MKEKRKSERERHPQQGHKVKDSFFILLSQGLDSELNMVMFTQAILNSVSCYTIA